MKVDYEKLKKGLEQLTGLDFISAEKEAKRRGDNSTEITLSKVFQSILAAKVLGVEYDEIVKLKISDFTAMTTLVLVFLAGSMDKAADLSSKED